MKEFRCPQCENRVIQKSGDAIRLRIRGPVTFGSDGRARAECHWCRTPLEIPVSLELARSQIEGERFVIRALDPEK